MEYNLKFCVPMTDIDFSQFRGLPVLPIPLNLFLCPIGFITIKQLATYSTTVLPSCSSSSEHCARHNTSIVSLVLFFVTKPLKSSYRIFFSHIAHVLLLTRIFELRETISGTEQGGYKNYLLIHSI